MTRFSLSITVLQVSSVATLIIAFKNSLTWALSDSLSASLIESEDHSNTLLSLISSLLIVAHCCSSFLEIGNKNLSGILSFICSSNDSKQILSESVIASANIIIESFNDCVLKFESVAERDCVW